MKIRLLKYDVIRIVASLMIVMIHVSAFVLTLCPDSGSIAYMIGNFFNGLSRAGTPLFLMLSGALLMDENKPFNTREFYKKSFRDICFLLIFWLVVYACFYTFIIPLIQGNTIDLHRSKLYLFVLPGGHYKHLWYMYMLIGTYISVPVLRLFVKKDNKKYILGIIILSLIVQFFVQTVKVLARDKSFMLSDYIDLFHIEYAKGYLFYILVGWYLSQIKLEKRTEIILISVGMISMLFIIVGVQLFAGEIPLIRDYISEMNTLPAALYGIGLFTLIQFLCRNYETKSVLIQKVSDSAFGVYVIHIVFLELLTLIIIPYSHFGEKWALPYIIILFLLVYVFSQLFVNLLSINKRVKYLFHYK